MATKAETVEKKTTKVSLYVGTYGSSTIVREDRMPQIMDKTEKTVEWLKAKGYEVKDIELIGDKPANWNSVFEIEPSTESPS